MSAPDWKPCCPECDKQDWEYKGDGYATCKNCGYQRELFAWEKNQVLQKCINQNHVRTVDQIERNEPCLDCQGLHDKAVEQRKQLN